MRLKRSGRDFKVPWSQMRMNFEPVNHQDTSIFFLFLISRWHWAVVKSHHSVLESLTKVRQLLLLWALGSSHILKTVFSHAFWKKHCIIQNNKLDAILKPCQYHTSCPADTVIYSAFTVCYKSYVLLFSCNICCLGHISLYQLIQRFPQQVVVQGRHVWPEIQTTSASVRRTYTILWTLREQRCYITQPWPIIY